MNETLEPWQIAYSAYCHHVRRKADFKPLEGYKEKEKWEAAARAVMLHERERCAKICDAVGDSYGQYREGGWRCAEVIRETKDD